MNQRLNAVVIGLLGVGALLYFGQFILVIVVTSLFIALVVSPLSAMIERARVPRIVAALLVVMLFVGVAAGIGTVAYGRAVSFVGALPQNARQIRARLRRLADRAAVLEKSTESALPSGSSEDAPVKVATQPGWGDVFAQLGNISELIFAITFLPFMVFFMLTGADHARRATVGLFEPDNRGQVAETIGRIVSIIRRFVVGNLLLGLALGAVSTVILGLFHIPFFYFLGFICGYLTLVPYLGGFLAPLLPMIISAGQKSGGGQEFLMGCCMLALHLFTINVIYPKLIGGTLKLNALSSTLALLVWGWLWGPLGLLFALPLTAAVKAICDHVEPLRPYGLWLGEESSVAEIRAAAKTAKLTVASRG